MTGPLWERGGGGGWGGGRGWGGGGVGGWGSTGHHWIPIQGTMAMVTLITRVTSTVY